MKFLAPLGVTHLYEIGFFCPLVLKIFQTLYILFVYFGLFSFMWQNTCAFPRHVTWSVCLWSSFSDHEPCEKGPRRADAEPWSAERRAPQAALQRNSDLTVFSFNIQMKRSCIICLVISFHFKVLPYYLYFTFLMVLIQSHNIKKKKKSINI